MNIITKIGRRLSDLLNPGAPALEGASPTSGASKARAKSRRASAPPGESDAAKVRKDWLALLGGILDAIAPFATSADDDSDEAVVRRMGTEALLHGIEALEWMGSIPNRADSDSNGGESRVIAQLRKDSKLGAKRRATLGALSLGEIAPRLSHALERAASVHLAGRGSDVAVVDGQRVRSEREEQVSPAVRRRCTLICFQAYAREVFDLRDQLELAASANPSLASAPRAVTKAFARAKVDEVRPVSGDVLELARARAVGFEDGEANDRIVRVAKPGIAYAGTVLRKAEVVVTRRRATKES
jgi:hypothetical protein